MFGVAVVDDAVGLTSGVLLGDGLLAVDDAVGLIAGVSLGDGLLAVVVDGARLASVVLLGDGLLVAVPLANAVELSVVGLAVGDSSVALAVVSLELINLRTFDGTAKTTAVKIRIRAITTDKVIAHNRMRRGQRNSSLDSVASFENRSTINKKQNIIIAGQTNF